MLLSISKKNKKKGLTTSTPCAIIKVQRKGKEVKTMMTMEMITAQLDRVLEDVSYEVHEDYIDLTIEDFGGYDKHWREIEREFVDEDAVDEVLDWLEEHADKVEGDFYRYYYFGEIWNEAANYDLVINTEFFQLPDILDILEKTLATTAKTAQLNENIIADATLKQNVKFELFIKNDIEIKHRNIQCNNGCVTITGNVSSNAVKERVNNILEQLPQVKNIENNLTPILKDIAKRKE
jgi:hypothetical protein